MYSINNNHMSSNEDPQVSPILEEACAAMGRSMIAFAQGGPIDGPEAELDALFDNCPAYDYADVR